MALREYTFGRDGDEGAITLASRWIRPTAFVLGGIASLVLPVLEIRDGAPAKVVLVSLGFTAFCVVVATIFVFAIRRQE